MKNKLYTFEKGLRQIQTLNQLLDLKPAALFIGYENLEQFIPFSKPQFLYLQYGIVRVIDGTAHI